MCKDVHSKTRAASKVGSEEKARKGRRGEEIIDRLWQACSRGRFDGCSTLAETGTVVDQGEAKGRKKERERLLPTLSSSLRFSCDRGVDCSRLSERLKQLGGQERQSWSRQGVELCAAGTTNVVAEQSRAEGGRWMEVIVWRRLEMEEVLGDGMGEDVGGWVCGTFSALILPAPTHPLTHSLSYPHHYCHSLTRTVDALATTILLLLLPPGTAPRHFLL